MTLYYRLQDDAERQLASVPFHQRYLHVDLSPRGEACGKDRGIESLGGGKRREGA